MLQDPARAATVLREFWATLAWLCPLRSGPAVRRLVRQRVDALSRWRGRWCCLCGRPAACVWFLKQILALCNGYRMRTW